MGLVFGVFRPRIVRRVPLEQRWTGNLSLILSLPWKHNSRHEAGDEVLLSEEPPTPSTTPEVTPLPPRSAEDPKLRDVRQFYVKPYDLDPAGGGIGFTDGCKGCRAIVFGTARTSHDNHCRHRVIKSAATNADVAARVKQATDRDVEYHAKKLETEKEVGKRRPETAISPEGRRSRDPRREEGVTEPFEENVSHAPGSSSLGQSGSRVIKTHMKTKSEAKKREAKAGVGGASGPAPSGTPQLPKLLRRIRLSRRLPWCTNYRQVGRCVCDREARKTVKSKEENLDRARVREPLQRKTICQALV